MLYLGRFSVLVTVIVSSFSASSAQELSDTSVLRDLDALHAEISELRTRLEQMESDISSVSNRLDDVPQNASMWAQTFQKNFDGVVKWTEIPSSDDAIYCALSRVDDDTGSGSCMVRRRNGRWEYIAGGTSSVNHCEVMCLRLQVKIE